MQWAFVHVRSRINHSKGKDGCWQTKGECDASDEIKYHRLLLTTIRSADGQNIFESLLAASLGSSLGRVGCTLTELDIDVVLIRARGSNALSRLPGFGRVGRDAVVVSPRGCGRCAFVTCCLCNAPELELDNSGFETDDERGDDVDFTNMDLEVDTRRPPSGG
jgi:hypothetical protein